MWRLQSSRDLLAVTRSCAALDCDGANAPIELTARYSSAHTLTESLVSLLRHRGSRAVDVVLDDALARWWTVRPPRGLKDLAELRNLAGIRFAELFGEPPADWHIAGDWHASRQFLCCAVESALAGAIRDAAESVGCRVRSMAPLFSRVVGDLREARRGSCWVFVSTGRSRVASAFVRGECQAVRASFRTKATDAQWLGQTRLACSVSLCPIYVLAKTAEIQVADESAERLIRLDDRRDLRVLDQAASAGSA